MTQEQKTKSDNKLVCIAEIVGAHGIRGIVKMKVFSNEPFRLKQYASIYGVERKTTFHIREISQHGNIWRVTLKDVTDRNAAEALRGTKLYVERSEMPEIEADDEFYHTDLIGMTAKHIDGTIMGKIKNVMNMGASDLLDIQPAKGQSFFIPFTNDAVPSVDMDERVVTIDPPAGLLD